MVLKAKAAKPARGARKTSKKAPKLAPVTAAASASPADVATTHTWSWLTAAVPAPTAEQAELYAVATAPAVLIERGSHIRSEKILTDMVRLYGVVAEFWPRATASQRRSLLGFSDGLLRVAVHAGVKLGEMVEKRGAGIGDRESKLAGDQGVAGSTYEEGMAERERLATAFEGLVHHDPSLEGRLAVARGRVTSNAVLAASLVALAKLGRALLANKKSVAARQLVEGGLTVQELAGAEALAKQVSATGAQASGARVRGSISQADLDLQDGVCLALLERVMRIFNGAHDRDPTIPKLVPIATRIIFAPPRKRAGAAKAEGETAPAKKDVDAGAATADGSKAAAGAPAEGGGEAGAAPAKSDAGGEPGVAEAAPAAAGAHETNGVASTEPQA